MRQTGKDNLIWHMSSKYGCEVNQWIKHAKILSMPWDCGSVQNLCQQINFRRPDLLSLVVLQHDLWLLLQSHGLTLRHKNLTGN